MKNYLESHKGLHLIPGQSIGLLYLGMTEEQIRAAIERIREPWKETCALNVFVDPDLEYGYTRYMDERLFFMVRYENDCAVEIGINRLLANTMPVLLDEMEVFRLPAAFWAAYLGLRSSCQMDGADEALAYEYQFQEIGVRLWRENVFDAKLLCDEQYMKDMGQMIAEEVSNYFFEMAFVYLPQK